MKLGTLMQGEGWNHVPANDLLSKLRREKEHLVKAGLLTASKVTTPIRGEEKPFGIPRDWTWVCLNEVSIIQEGPGIRKSQYRPEGIQFLTVTNILEGEVDLQKSSKYVSTEEFDSKYRHFKINRGDIVVACSGGSWGKSAIFDCSDTVILNTSTLRLRFFGDLGDNKYLYYLTKADFFKHQIEEQLTGQQPNFGYSHYSIVQIPLPPLPEQQRIVAILDEALAGIATAKANAEQNLQNARALFKSQLQSVFTQRGKGWVEKPFEDLIASNVIGLTKGSRDQGENKAWPYVKMNNITRDNRFDFSRFTCVDATDEEVTKFSLRDGDFLFNTRNSYELVGKSCIYESDSNDAVLYNNNIMRVRFNSAVNARFVLLAFSSKAVADELDALKSGTTNVSAIYFKDLKSLVVPVPPIATQKAIAAKLESLVAETQRLAGLYERKLAALEALRKSLLHQAFTGELT